MERSLTNDEINALQVVLIALCDVRRATCDV
jgi:hypothetical protein